MVLTIALLLFPDGAFASRHTATMFVRDGMVALAAVPWTRRKVQSQLDGVMALLSYLDRAPGMELLMKKRGSTISACTQLCHSFASLQPAGFVLFQSCPFH